MQRKIRLLSLLLAAAPLVCPAASQTRTVRFVQDDAQDYMVSKIFSLKHVKADDITPFLLGAVRRYNVNSSVNRINYKAADEQLLTVSCPQGMMPYVEEFVQTVDRPPAAGTTAGIAGTGITNVVYEPEYRSSQQMVNILYSLGINSGKADSFIGYDQNSNQIYWKDGAYKSGDILKCLKFLDRSAPQVNITVRLYEIRESNLRDLGIDYLGWKNGPGLNLFQAGFDAWGVSSAGSAAIQALSGSMGGFFFAPQFDASFIRCLQQSGTAKLRNTANLTVTNTDSKTFEIQFAPEMQNIVKSDNDRTSVEVSAVAGTLGVSPLQLQMSKIAICLAGAADAKTGELPFSQESYREQTGTLVFRYTLQAANVVERNNYGAELVETTELQGDVSMQLATEKMLGVWSKDAEVEQTIGVPFLSEVPVLKYLFSTTTTSRENVWVAVTAQAELAHPAGFTPAPGLLLALGEQSGDNE